MWIALFYSLHPSISQKELIFVLHTFLESCVHAHNNNSNRKQEHSKKRLIADNMDSVHDHGEFYHGNFTHQFLNTTQGVRCSPQGIPEFQAVVELFTSEWSAVQFLRNCMVIEWADKYLVCPACEQYAVKMVRNYDPSKDGDIVPRDCYKMRCSGKCIYGPNKRWKQSIFKNTYFHSARMKKNEMLHFLYLWATENTPKQIHTVLRWSPNTINDWLNYNREMCAMFVRNDPDIWQIGGPGIIVQIDESKFGKRKYNRGHRVEGVWVFGGVEYLRDPNTQSGYVGRWFAVTVPDRTRDTLWPIIQRHIRPGSIIHSDCWKPYDGLENLLGQEYQHGTVNHSEDFVDPSTGVHTNGIEGHWNVLKEKLPKQCYSIDRIQAYLFEQMWRNKHKGRIWDAIFECLAQLRFDEDSHVWTFD